jgi:hypothetical protein
LPPGEGPVTIEIEHRGGSLLVRASDDSGATQAFVLKLPDRWPAGPLDN